MSATPILRVIGGFDSGGEGTSKAALAAARRRARPILREWLKRVEHHVVSGQLAALADDDGAGA